METADKSTLLVEYQVCLSDTSQLDNDIWQTTNIFLGVSVVGFSYLIQSQCKTFNEYAVIIVLACFGMGLVYLWRKFTYSWLKIIHINLYRMREIEKELGMKKEHYILFIEEERDTEKDKFIMSDCEKNKLLELLSDFTKKSKLGGPSGVNIYLNKLMIYIIIGWFTLIIKQLILLLYN